jgi:XRE family aerobic/anaerobic benzoate catabolism transcriptional regulator
MARAPDAVDTFLAATTAPGDPATPDEAAYLAAIAERLRTIRARRGMSRRLLAEQSGISERYIARMEGATGNASLLVIRAIAAALGIAPADIFADREEARSPLDQLTARLDPAQRLEAHALLARHFSARPDKLRAGRIALIGLRGAGKSTLGRMLAEARGVPFHELGQAIAHAADTTIGAIFEHRGQGAFRRLEREALERLLAAPGPAVIAAGGSIVATEPTYALLLRACRTIWLRATPAEHMARVTAQGDLRPMADRGTAMEDLRAILASREPLYARAEFTLDTSGKPPEAAFSDLLQLLA